MWDNPKNRQLIREIYEKRLIIDDPRVVLNTIHQLIDIAFAGGFFTGAYFKWNCGSWLGTMIRDVVIKCEKLTHKDLCQLVNEDYSNRHQEQWSNFMESYGFLPIPCYKKDEDIDHLIKGACENWKKIYRHKQSVHLASAKTPAMKIDLNDSLHDRFDRYLANIEHWRSFQKYFGKRLSDQEQQEFKKIYFSLNSDTKKELCKVIKDSKYPFWRRFSKRLLASEMQ